MPNDPDKSSDQLQQQEEKASSWSWSLFGSSTKAPKSAKRPPGTDPTTHATPTRLPRFDLSTPSSSAAPTSNGFPPSFAAVSSMASDRSAPATTDSKPAASTYPARGAMAGGYTTKTPSAGSNAAGVTGTTVRTDGFKSPWKHPSTNDNGTDPRGLMIANFGNPIPTIRPQPITIVRSQRYYSSKSSLLTQNRGLRRAGMKRSLEDPELFKRVLGDPQSQHQLRRVMDGSTPARHEQGFDRFLPKRAFGTYQSGTRVPLSDSRLESEEDGDGPPRKKARKVTFEESGGLTYSEPSWNARKTPVPKSQRRFERSDDFRSHNDNNDDDGSNLSRSRNTVMDSEPSLYSYLPPYHFRSNGNQLRPGGVNDVPHFRFLSSGASAQQLHPLNDALDVDNYDEAAYMKECKEESAIAEAKDKVTAELFAPIEGQKWTCNFCHGQSDHDESKCVHCKRSRGLNPDKQKLGWDANMFSAQSFGSWKCPTCSVNNRKNDKVCRACQEERPSDGDESAESNGQADSKESNKAVVSLPNAQESIPGKPVFGLTSAPPTASASSIFGHQSAQPDTPNTIGNSGPILFGFQANAPVSTSASEVERKKVDSSLFSGLGSANADKANEKPIFGLAPGQGTTKSSPDGFRSDIPTSSRSSGMGFTFGVPEAKADSSADEKESKDKDASGEPPTVLPPFAKLPVLQSQPKTNDGVSGSAKEPSASSGAPIFGLNASAAPFLFGGQELPTASTTPAFTFDSTNAAPSASSYSESVDKNATREMDRASRGEDRTKRARSSETPSVGDNDGTKPFSAAPTPTPTALLFGGSTTVASNQISSEAGAGAVGTAALPNTFGTLGTQADTGETPLLFKPGFSFGSSNSAFPSGSSTAAQGFALNATPTPAEPPTTVVATPAPASSTLFSFGSATPAAAPFSFGSPNPPGLGATSSTPATTTTGFGSLGGTNPMEGNAPSAPSTLFGSSAGATPTMAFGNGSLSTPSNPTTFGFGNSMSSTPATFGSAPDPFASQASSLPSAGFAPAQTFGGMPSMASTPVTMSFGSAPVATRLGNGFGSMNNFGAAPTPVMPAFGGGGGFALPGMQQQDVSFSIGSSSGGSKGPASRGARRILKAKRPAGAR